jgi:hypothetical protein
MNLLASRVLREPRACSGRFLRALCFDDRPAPDPVALLVKRTSAHCALVNCLTSNGESRHLVDPLDSETGGAEYYAQRR